MEDLFDTLLYPITVIVGVIYLFLNNSKSSNADKKTVVGNPYEYQPAPTASKNWSNTWEKETPKAPGIKEPWTQTVVKEMSPSPVHHIIPQLATQQPPSKKIDRVLRRYSSWKKAIIMAELIQPYS